MAIGEGMSPADYAAVSHNDDSFGGGGVGIFIFALIILALLGGNGFGVGGNGGGALTEATLCNANNFTQLENAVGRLNDSQSQQNMMLSNGLCELGYQTQAQFANLQRDMCTAFASVTQSVNDVAWRMQNCCCETQRAIDGVNYNAQLNTNAIMQNQNENTQRVLDYLTTTENNNLREQLLLSNIQQQFNGIPRFQLGNVYGTVPLNFSPFFNQGCAC